MNLSQMTGGGGDSYIGEIVSGNPNVLGINPVLGNKEYLQTGILKRITGNNEYSAVVQQQPLLCFKDGYNNTQAWDYNNWSLSSAQIRHSSFGGFNINWPRVIKHPNGNYFFCMYMYCGHMYPEYGYADEGRYGTFIRWGSNLNGGVAGGHSRYAWYNNGAEWLINDFALFKNFIFYAARSNSTTPGGGQGIQIWRSSGGDFSNVFNPVDGGNWGDGGNYYTFRSDWRQTYFAASPDILLMIPYNPFTWVDNVRAINAVFRTTDGINFSAITNTIPTTQARFTWSPTANTQLVGQGFIYLGTNNTWYTSANGNVWTQRATAAFGLQNQSPDATFHTVAHSNTTTIFSFGSSNGLDNYLYRTTDGSSYQPINLADFPSLRGIFCRNGITGGTSVHTIHYTPQGNSFILMTTQGATAVSTDEGVTWQLRPSFRHLRHIYPRSRGTANGDFIFVNPPGDFGQPLTNAAIRISPVSVIWRETTFTPNNIVCISPTSSSNVGGGLNTGNTFVIANTIWSDGTTQWTPIEVSANSALSGNIAAANVADYVGMAERVAISGNLSYSNSSAIQPFNSRPLETYVRIR